MMRKILSEIAKEFKVISLDSLGVGIKDGKGVAGSATFFAISLVLVFDL